MDWWSSAALAHFMLNERVQKMGVVGCVSCIVGSVIIVIHAPQEHTLNSVQEIWDLATQPGLALSFALTGPCYLFLLHLELLIACLLLLGSLSSLRSSFTFNSSGFSFALWTSLWPNQYTGIFGDMFVYGFFNGNWFYFFCLLGNSVQDVTAQFLILCHYFFDPLTH